MSVAQAENESGPLGLVLARAGKRQRAGKGWLVRCPAHGDRSPSLSVTEGSDGRVLLNCHAGCEAGAIAEAWGLTLSDLFPPRPAHLAPVSPLGCTLDGMAVRTKLPRDALIGLGWSDAEFHGHPCVDIPYERRDGTVHRVRVRRAVSGEKRFAWREGQGTIAYEPDHGRLAQEHGFVIVCEGETDVVTLIFAGLPAIGAPGANATHALEREHLTGVSRIFAVQETDAAGEQFVAGVRDRLGKLGFSGQVHALPMPGGAKDPNALWQCNPDVHAFKAQLEAAMREAVEGPRPAYRLLSDMVAESLRPVGQRLSTSVPTLDDATRGGIPRARVVGILGAPGAGKSTWATQLAHSFEQQGCAVAYVADDEPSEGIITRLGQLEGFSRDGLESEGEAGDSVRAGLARRFQGRAIIVIDPDADDAMRTIEDAERALIHLAGERPRVLIVDSLQTAHCAAADAAESQRERIDAKLKVIKAIAKRGTLVLFISEMARSAYRTGDRNVDTGALAAGKESGSIEYGAALLLGMRSVKGEHGLVDVEVAKNRLGGHKPEFRLALDFDRASFSEVEMPEGGEDRRSTEEARAARARERIVAALKETHNMRAANEVSRAAGGNKQDNLAMLREMVEAGEVVKVEGQFRLAPNAQEHVHG